MRSVLYRLFFTRDDDLDLLQIVFLLWVVFVGVAIAKVGAGDWKLPNSAWVTIMSVFATLAITGVPTWLAHILAARKQEMKFADESGYYGVDAPPGGP